METTVRNQENAGGLVVGRLPSNRINLSASGNDKGVNQARLYSILFSSAAATLLEFGQNNLKTKLGVTAVLHTWGQNLSDHYHLHCVVTGGGLSEDEQSWVSIRPNWLFPVRALISTSPTCRGSYTSQPPSHHPTISLSHQLD